MGKKLYIATPEQAKLNDKLGKIVPPDQTKHKKELGKIDPDDQPTPLRLTERTPLMVREVDEATVFEQCLGSRISAPIEGFTMLFSAATVATGIVVASSDSASSRLMVCGSLATVGSVVTASTAAARVISICRNALRSTDSDEENQYLARSSQPKGCCCSEILGAFASAVIVGANIAALEEPMPGKIQAVVAISIGVALVLILLFVGKFVDMINRACCKT